MVSRRCDCGAVTTGDVPPGVVGGPVCHGPNVTAAAAFLHACGQVADERTAEVVNGLFGTDVPPGWIGKIPTRPAGALFGFEDDIRFALPAAERLADETSVNTVEDVEVHLKISGCFRTLATTQAYCRIHSHLITTRLYHVPPMLTIRDALAGNAWTP